MPSSELSVRSHYLCYVNWITFNPCVIHVICVIHFCSSVDSDRTHFITLCHIITIGRWVYKTSCTMVQSVPSSLIANRKSQFVTMTVKLLSLSWTSSITETLYHAHRHDRWLMSVRTVSVILYPMTAWTDKGAHPVSRPVWCVCIKEFFFHWTHSYTIGWWVYKTSCTMVQD